MSRRYTIEPVFVTSMPDELEDGKLYISIPYRMVMHKCACGCNEIVQTPLDSEDGWSITFDGETISMWPSIGNINFVCKSHYVIRNNEILWCRSFDNHVESSMKHENSKFLWNLPFLKKKSKKGKKIK